MKIGENQIKKNLMFLIVVLICIGTIFILYSRNSEEQDYNDFGYVEHKLPEGTYICSGTDSQNRSFSITYIFNNNGTGKGYQKTIYGESVADFLWREENSRIYLHKTSLKTDPVLELIYESDFDRLISTTGDKIYIKNK